MNLEKQEFKTEFRGKQLTLEVSKLAEQANAAVLGTHGDTSVLVTAVMGNRDRKELDYFPLVVDYEERFYAAGKIIGSRFVRREGRPSEEAVLSGRMIDRTLRPLFNHKIRRDVQIVITILSYDEETDPDFISLLSASAALAISDIPWNGPVAGVQLNKENFDAFVAGTEERINMIEFAGKEVPEEEVIKEFEIAQGEIKELIKFQKGIVGKVGKAKAEVYLAEPSAELKEKINKFLKGKLEGAIYEKNKSAYETKLGELKESLKEHLRETEEDAETIGAADELFEKEINDLVHKNTIESDKRPDGRGLDEVRDLYTEVGLFKRLHGSALFMRGSTQALAVVTLAPPGAEQLIETMERTAKRRFMLHYNFPPYSTGEIGRMGGTGRREIGHGALAEKAVRALIPSQEEFPYTIRVVSEILSSNGSSSMATVCASILALMDAGVPIKEPAAGIAMGLMSDSSGRYKILTDIQGPEDHHGDMDCKVAGTKNGVTAIQMDVKIDGITLKILEETLAQTKKNRLHILQNMLKTLDKPRATTSSYAPVVLIIKIDPKKIGEVIGPGGKVINGIIKDTGATSIDIEQTGKVYVAGPDREKAEAAFNQVKAIVREYQVGEIVEGDIVRILDFGAIVDLGGGQDGMIHVSELRSGFVKQVEDVVKLGDHVRAKIIRAEDGKIGLSLKAMNE